MFPLPWPPYSHPRSLYGHWSVPRIGTGRGLKAHSVLRTILLSDAQGQHQREGSFGAGLAGWQFRCAGAHICFGGEIELWLAHSHSLTRFAKGGSWMGASKHL